MPERYLLSRLVFVVPDEGNPYVEALLPNGRMLRIPAEIVLTEQEQITKTARQLCYDFLYGKTGDDELVRRYLDGFHGSTWNAFISDDRTTLLYEAIWGAFITWRE